MLRTHHGPCRSFEWLPLGSTSRQPGLRPASWWRTRPISERRGRPGLMGSIPPLSYCFRLLFLTGADAALRYTQAGAENAGHKLPLSVACRMEPGDLTQLARGVQQRAIGRAPMPRRAFPQALRHFRMPAFLPALLAQARFRS